MDDNIHKDHRSRLRKRYEREGLSNFENHNVLELLLFYAIPRKDTNPIAHRLLRRFGSLHAVFEASEDELCEVEGIGKSTASFIRMCPEIAKRVTAQSLESEPFCTGSRFGSYFVNYFRFTPPETACVMFLDTDLCFVSNELLSYGELNRPECILEKTLEVAEGKKALYAVLAHNHGDVGTAPTAQDVGVTEEIRVALAEKGIHLIAHFIVSGYDYENFMKTEEGEKYNDI